MHGLCVACFWAAAFIYVDRVAGPEVRGSVQTFFGTLVGQAWVSTPLSVAFLALAAGSILFVVIELIPICRRMASKEVVMAGVFVGIVLGFATDFILIAAGA